MSLWKLQALFGLGFSSFVRICTTEFIVFEVGRFLGEYVAMMASHGDLPKFKAVFF